MHLSRKRPLRISTKLFCIGVCNAMAYDVPLKLPLSQPYRGTQPTGGGGWRQRDLYYLRSRRIFSEVSKWKGPKDEIQFGSAVFGRQIVVFDIEHTSWPGFVKSGCNMPGKFAEII